MVQLSDVVGVHLNGHLKIFLSIVFNFLILIFFIKKFLKLCRKLTQRKYKDQVTDALNKFEQNGGKEVVPIIKSKIPTYSSVT